MQQPIISIRMDESLKKRFELICDELGLSVSAAVTIFAKQVCREGKIPFEITLGKDYKEKGYMSRIISFKVAIWDADNLSDKIIRSFNALKEALDYIEDKTEILFQEYGTWIYFAIEIINLDSHKHVLFFDDNSRYERDGKMVDKIDYDQELVEENERYLYNFIEGYISALINS